jgi:hypothetical protein
MLERGRVQRSSCLEGGACTPAARRCSAWCIRTGSVLLRCAAWLRSAVARTATYHLWAQRSCKQASLATGAASAIDSTLIARRWRAVSCGTAARVCMGFAALQKQHQDHAN